MNVGAFYPRLVREFIVNLPKMMNDASKSSESRKVHVRGHCFNFSLSLINQFLERDEDNVQEQRPSIPKLVSV